MRIICPGAGSFIMRRFPPNLLARGCFSANGFFMKSLDNESSFTLATLNTIPASVPVDCSILPKGWCIPSGPSLSRPFSSTSQAVVSSKKKKSSKVILDNNDNSPASSAEDTELGYYASKKLKKERRRALFDASQARKERLRTRRDGRSRGVKKAQFNSWFIPHKVNNEFHQRKARQQGLEWNIQVSTILVRQPVVEPDKEAYEIDFEDLQSHVYQFGKEYPQDLIELDYDADFAVSDEDLLKLLPANFTPAPRETEADANNYVRTLDRKLKTDIYLAVKRKDDECWQFPTVDLRDEEYLLDASRRAIVETIGSKIEFWTLSNAPVAVQISPYIEDQWTTGFYGKKRFFLKLYYDEGEVVPDESIHDFAWLDRAELTSLLEDKFYHYAL